MNIAKRAIKISEEKKTECTTLILIAHKKI